MRSTPRQLKRKRAPRDELEESRSHSGPPRRVDHHQVELVGRGELDEHRRVVFGHE